MRKKSDRRVEMSKDIHEDMNNLIRNLHSLDIATSETLHKLCEGDHEGFQKIYLLWKKPISDFVRRKLGSSLKVDDITQDVFLTLWEMREQIKVDKNIRSFLFLIAQRIVYNDYRSKKVQEKYYKLYSEDESDNTTSHDLVVEKEIELLKRSILKKMPPQQRRIFEMNIDEGLSAEEIADTLGVKRDTVYTQLSKAKKKIIDVLSHY